MPEQQDVCSRYVNAKCIDPETGKPMSKVKIAGGSLENQEVTISGGNLDTQEVTVVGGNLDNQEVTITGGNLDTQDVVIKTDETGPKEVILAGDITTQPKHVYLIGGKLTPEPVLAYPELGRVSTEISQIIDSVMLSTNPYYFGNDYVIDKIIYYNTTVVKRDVFVHLRNENTDAIIYQKPIGIHEMDVIDFRGGLFLGDSAYTIAENDDSIRMTVIGRYNDEHFIK